MNKIGIFYAYWTRDWDVDFVPYVDKVTDLGFDILEVNAGTIADISAGKRRELKRAADGRGIGLSFCVGLQEQYDVSNSDPSVRRRGIEYLKKIALAAGEMGGGNVSGILYGYWPATIGDVRDKPAYVKRSIASMREAVKAAEDNGVIFNVEVVNRFEQFMMNTCEEALEYIRQVDSPNCRILLDTYHMNIEEDDMCEAIKKAGSKLGQLHIGENNRRPPGTGHMPWKAIAKALKEIGYEGPVVMEPFLIPGGEIGRDIHIWHDYMPGCDLDREAKKAVDFMRTVLSAD